MTSFPNLSLKPHVDKLYDYFALDHFVFVTLNISYCFILNNWIGHKFHNL